jgi:hypothetical protein
MEGSDEAACVAVAPAVHDTIVAVRGAIAACCIGCRTVAAKIAIVSVSHFNPTSHGVRRSFSNTFTSVRCVNADVWL